MSRRMAIYFAVTALLFSFGEGAIVALAATHQDVPTALVWAVSLVGLFFGNAAVRFLSILRGGAW